MLKMNSSIIRIDGTRSITITAEGSESGQAAIQNDPLPREVAGRFAIAYVLRSPLWL
jgi:hypothetical protein